jgi:hypothetical protein
MAPPFIRPSVSDLDFEVYARPLHPELFDVLAERVIRHSDFHLAVRVTRTGHVICWNDGRSHLTEVTAAADQELPLRGRLLHRPFRHEQSARCEGGRGVRYQATFQIETLAPSLYEGVHREIRADGGKRGLFFDFAPGSRLALAPLSHLTAEYRPGCLFLTSFHTFPEEHVVLKTQSLIERTK